MRVTTATKGYKNLMPLRVSL